jgi:hypothetical protein
VGSDQTSGAGGAEPGHDLKVERHLLDCSNRRAEVRLQQSTTPCSAREIRVSMKAHRKAALRMLLTLRLKV